MSKFITVTYRHDGEPIETFVNVDKIVFIRNTNDLDEKDNITVIAFG